MIKSNNVNTYKDSFGRMRSASFAIMVVDFALGFHNWRLVNVLFSFVDSVGGTGHSV